MTDVSSVHRRLAMLTACVALAWVAGMRVPVAAQNPASPARWRGQ